MLAALMAPEEPNASPWPMEAPTAIRHEVARLDPAVRALVAHMLRQPRTSPDVQDCCHEIYRRALEGADRLRHGKPRKESSGSGLAGLARKAGGSMTSMAVLFVFGAVLFGLATRRMELLQAEVAARPMRSFAWGVLGALIALVAAVALCVTVIGIPVAVVGILGAVFAAYAGICSVLAAVGGALVRHRSANPYVHLGVGCALYLCLSAVPYIGDLATTALAFIGIGVVVVTRGAGLVPDRKRGNAGSGPYRSAAAA